MKLLLPCLLCILYVSSCQKSSNEYYQSYNVMYFQHLDSFSAAAAFHLGPQYAGPVALGKKESIAFNGMHADYIENNVYFWTGTGKPDANFVFTRRRKEMVGSIKASELGSYELIFPDTISIAKGFSMRIIGQNNSKKIYIHLQDPGKIGISCTIKGDSVHIYPGHIENWREGRMIVSLREVNTARTIGDDNYPADISYSLEYEKSVQFVK